MSHPASDRTLTRASDDDARSPLRFALRAPLRGDRPAWPTGPCRQDDATQLNQVEIFFSILQRRLLKHGAFDSEADLAEQMLCFVETYNQTATPFRWTYTGKVLNA